MSASSLTTPTLCWRGQQLHRNCVRVVNYYADIMSAQFETMPTSCPRSQQLCGHGFSIVNDYPDMVSAQSTTTRTWCQRSQQQCLQSVSVVNDHRDTEFLKNQIAVFVTFLKFFLFCEYLGENEKNCEIVFAVHMGAQV